jgi:hypothetical protein
MKFKAMVEEECSRKICIIWFSGEEFEMFTANCRLGKARPNPLDGDNGGRVYPLSPQINPPSLL